VIAWDLTEEDRLQKLPFILSSINNLLCNDPWLLGDDLGGLHE
jgi:hypothetical protein